LRSAGRPERLRFAVHFLVMKQLLALAAILLIIAAGGVYIAKQGDTDRNVPGHTTGTGKNRIGN
jgi:hypothetical protein